jgi:hypothetical protein
VLKHLAAHTEQRHTCVADAAHAHARRCALRPAVCLAELSTFVTLYDLSSLPAQFCDETINVRNFEIHRQMADRSAPCHLQRRGCCSVNRWARVAASGGGGWGAVRASNVGLMNALWRINLMLASSRWLFKTVHSYFDSRTFRCQKVQIIISS